MPVYEPLTGLMRAMTMPFPVADRRLLGVASAGERVRSTVVERRRDVVVVAVEREEGPPVARRGAEP